MPDLAHDLFELGGCFFGAAVGETYGNFPPGSRHLFCEGFELSVNFLGGGEGMSGIPLVAGEDEAGDLAEVLVIALFGCKPWSMVVEMEWC